MASSGQIRPSQLKGYNLLANLMAEHSDLAIYRRFMGAHHFDLMLQQAELIHLLHDLGLTKLDDMLNPTGDFRQFDTFFYTLIESNRNADDKSQWHKLMLVRHKLKEFGDHLLQVRSLFNLPTKNTDDVHVLREWLNHREGGNGFLDGDEAETWVEGTENDLTSLYGHGEQQDPLSKLLEGKVLSWVHEKGLHKFRDNYVSITDPFLSAQVNTYMAVYSGKTIRNMVSALSTILSSLLPTMSIFVLYYVKKLLVRLGLILVFTVMFSAIVVSVTCAKRSECFAATVAFAAVLVVFVGSTGDGSAGCSSS